VPCSSQVHRVNGKFYDRSVDGDFEVRENNKIAALYSSKTNNFTETRVYPYLQFSHFKQSLFPKVRNMLRNRDENHSLLDLSDKELLRALGLYREDLENNTQGYTLAAALLFGKDETIQSILPHHKIDALLRRRDVERYDDRLEIRTNLIEAYELLMGFMQKHLPDPFYMEKDIRISLRDKIFREIVANMIVHREYTNSMPGRMLIYSNCVETENPSKPYKIGPLDLDNSCPIPKNPLIAKFFVQLGRVEELGSGIRNVSKYLPIYSNGQRPQFIEGDVFKTILPTITDTNEQVNEKSKKILLLIESGKARKAKDLSQIAKFLFNQLEDMFKFFVIRT
jgi:ATP-dependent DNA helicase RecG